MILVDQVGSVAVLKLNKGVTNPMDLEFVNELTEVLQRLKTDNKVRGLVLTSSNDKFYSIGFDIPNLFELHRDDLHTFIIHLTEPVWSCIPCPNRQLQQ